MVAFEDRWLLYSNMVNVLELTARVIRSGFATYSVQLLSFLIAGGGFEHRRLWVVSPV